FANCLVLLAALPSLAREGTTAKINWQRNQASYPYIFSLIPTRVENFDAGPSGDMKEKGKRGSALFQVPSCHENVYSP
ncbi:hypothetical protein ACJX0J_009763, partial [Zea mays]